MLFALAFCFLNFVLLFESGPNSARGHPIVSIKGMLCFHGYLSKVMSTHNELIPREIDG